MNNNLKLIVAGSRTIFNEKFVFSKIDEVRNLHNIKEIVSGGANGVDKLAEQYSEKYKIEFTKFPANWFTFGKKAGMIRNADMAAYSDILLLVWDGKSPGSANMLMNAKKMKLIIYEYII